MPWHFTCLLYSSIENIFQAASSKPHPCDNVQCCRALYLPSSPQSSALQLWLRIWPLSLAFTQHTDSQYTDAGDCIDSPIGWRLCFVGVWSFISVIRNGFVFVVTHIFGAEDKFLQFFSPSDCLGACDIFFSRCFVDKERGVSRQVYVSSVPQHHIVAAVLQHRELSTTIKQVFFDIFPSSQPWNCSKNIIVVTTDPHYRISNTLYIVNWCRFYPYYSCKSWL